MSGRNFIEGEAMLDDDEENEVEPGDDYDGEVRNGPAKPKKYENDSSEEDEEEEDEEAARAVRITQITRCVIISLTITRFKKASLSTKMRRSKIVPNADKKRRNDGEKSVNAKMNIWTTMI